MPRITRNTIVRLLLVATTLALGCVYGYYYGRAWVAKWTFAHQTTFGIDELVLITVPKKELSAQNAYLADEGEFVWQGEMVDVLHREIRSDTLFIYGFRDAVETDLREAAAWLYPNLTTTQSEPLSDTRTKRIKWFSPFVVPYSHTGLPASVASLLLTRPYVRYASTLRRLPFLEVLTPPPNVI